MKIKLFLFLILIAIRAQAEDGWDDKVGHIVVGAGFKFSPWARIGFDSWEIGFVNSSLGVTVMKYAFAGPMQAGLGPVYAFGNYCRCCSGACFFDANYGVYVYINNSA